MSKTRGAYSFSVLRYVHDAVTGEFVNVGVVLYSQAHRYLGARFSTSYSRASSFFNGIDGRHYRSLLRHFSDTVDEMREWYYSGVERGRPPKSVAEITSDILPHDDSALQFSPGCGGGITDDAQATLDTLFERYVEQYLLSRDRERRTDQQILALFKPALQRRKILAQLRPREVRAPNYSHEFPLSWKNGVLNVCEPVSFDFIDASSLIEKANLWLGRVVSLHDSKTRFKIHMLIGEPTNRDLWKPYSTAQSILGSMPVDHELVGEESVEAFAEKVAEDVQVFAG